MTEKKCPLRPTMDRVVVTKMDFEGVTSGGIVIPVNSTDRSRPVKVKVEAVGPGNINADNDRQPMEVAPGDIGYIMEQVATKIKVDDTEYLVVNHRDISVVLSGD